MRKSKQKRQRVKSPPGNIPISKPKQKYKGIDNTRDLNVFLGKTKLFQDVIGLTREQISSLFEQSIIFLQQNRVEEAIAAFSLLTKINPYVADYWIGLGVARLYHEEYPLAFDALSMALTMDPNRYECYAYSIECCLAMNNIAQAEALLAQAISYARRHPAHEQSDVILEEAPRLEARINDQKPHKP